MQEFKKGQGKGRSLLLPSKSILWLLILVECQNMVAAGEGGIQK